MRVPKPKRLLRQVIRMQSQTYTVDRQTVGTGPMGEALNSESTVSVDAFLFSPDENSIMSQFGEQVTGDMGLLALSGEDIQYEDEFTHNGETFSVEELDTFNDNGTVYQYGSLQRKVN